MKTVLLKSRAAFAGGLEKHVGKIATALLERGDEVTLLTTGKASANPLLSVASTYTSPWPSFLRMEQFDRFVQNYLKKNKADLIIGMDRNREQTHIRAGNGVHAAYLQSRIASEGKLKYLLCKINPLHQKILEIEKEAFENPKLKKIIANSHMVKEEILERYKVEPSKIAVIHNGVEWHEMSSSFESSEEKKDPNRFHFLFIGNGYLRKGLNQLLEALALLSEKDFFLSVVGKDKNIDLYRKKASVLGLEKQVAFFGPQKEILPFYQRADALVIPSFYDPFANVTVEALAMGLFVVSSKTNGGHEILTKTNGVVIEGSLVSALEIALKNPKTKKSSLQIRETVKHLDFSNQMRLFLEACE